MTLYIHAEKIQHYDSGSGLRDAVDAVCIDWVVVWVGWRGEDSISGGEVTTTFIKSVVHSLKHIGIFIFKLESLSISKRVGKESVDEEITSSSIEFMTASFLT